MTEEERKQLRLERNREIARNCRKRQREKMVQMEEEVKRLKEEQGIIEKDEPTIV